MIRSIVMRLLVLLALSIFIAGFLFSQSQTESPALETGVKRSCELPAGRSQEHHVLLEAGQYARVNIAQHTINVSVSVFDPTGKQQFVIDNTPIDEVEDVELIAITPGKYRLQVTAAETHASSLRYEITFVELSPETERHRSRIAAAREVGLASAASRQGTREAMLQAIHHFESARLHWRAAGDAVEEARTMCAIAFIYIELGNREKALSYASEALPLAPVAHHDQLLGRVLDCIGEVYNKFSDKKAAIDHHLQALPLLQSSGDRAGEAQTLSNMGVAYLGMGEKHKALELFDQSMRILRPLQDRRTLAVVASNIGRHMTTSGTTNSPSRAFSMRSRYAGKWGIEPPKV
jgi:tetratricopeptide (TPR) repeat protein